MSEWVFSTLQKQQTDHFVTTFRSNEYGGMPTNCAWLDFIDVETKHSLRKGLAKIVSTFEGPKEIFQRYANLKCTLSKAENLNQ